MNTALLIICGVVFVLVALLMIVAILLQESKGGGLAALGGTRAESAFGASNPLRKMTTVLAVIFLLLSSFLALQLKGKASVLKGEKKETPVTAEAEDKNAKGTEPKKGVEATAPIPEAPKAPEKDSSKPAEGEKPATPPATTEGNK